MSNEVHHISFNDKKLRLDICFTEDNFEVASMRIRLVSREYGILQESASIPVKALFDMVSLIEVSIIERTQKLQNDIARMKREKEE